MYKGQNVGVDAFIDPQRTMILNLMKRRIFMNKYIGHPAQIYGVEEMRLTGGKGDGMRMLYVRNGKGLEFWVSLDRCADITRLSLKGDNFSFISACGNVSPNYYDKEGLGFLKSFTAGFCTTCGLTAVGNPCTDDGEQLPLHGTISNIPCENFAYSIEDNNIYIRATVRDARIFSHKLILEREYVVSLDENKLTMIRHVLRLRQGGNGQARPEALPRPPAGDRPDLRPGRRAAGGR